MAPAPITEDYYLVLEVLQSASLELITRSYKRLALKLHPDRNRSHDATEAFQLLGRAYETLRDESKRRAYDLIYPSIKRAHPSTSTTQTPRSPPSSTPQGVLSDETQLAALHRSKQERSARWQTRNASFVSSMFSIRIKMQQLEQAIKKLDDITEAEAVEEARKNTWGAWLPSIIYKRVEDTEEEKERKDRAKQERRLEKDMKERRLAVEQANLKNQELLLKQAKDEVDAADLLDNMRILVIRQRIWAREEKERNEREKKERERLEKIWKKAQEEQERREQEEREAWLREAEKRREEEARAAGQRRKQAQEAEKRRNEERTAEQKRVEALAADKRRKAAKAAKATEQRRNEEQARRRQYPFEDEISPSTCIHNGWWPKVEGRTACPECSEVWNYLLECPTCALMACPRCQAGLRPRVFGYGYDERTTSPVFDYRYDWD
ncbi:DnaJ domain-domain-containing protein [Clohesyomyces aquaticus]|uniref:DnaJ domain-domain-containing protein n=1 Tax=Clohesyomyces aquaticus TaxID=1231657 RepID=A0A1Y1YLE1_9PLEO|nr:DnaJ domain-domain-containing protein [Clohesyomyces aquaticus]